MLPLSLLLKSLRFEGSHCFEKVIPYNGIIGDVRSNFRADGAKQNGKHFGNRSVVSLLP